VEQSVRCSVCSDQVKPIVALDIDGTLGEYHGQFVKFATMYFDTSFPPAYGFDGSMELHEYLGLELTEYRRAKLAYRQGGFQRWMPMRPGADWLVNHLRDEGFEIWVTTTRPYERYDGTDPDTREWLSRNSIPWDNLLYSEDKYEVLHKRVDPSRVKLILDDLPKNIVAAQEHWPSRILCLLDRPHNTKDPLLDRVNGWMAHSLEGVAQMPSLKMEFAA